MGHNSPVSALFTLNNWAVTRSKTSKDLNNVIIFQLWCSMYANKWSINKQTQLTSLTLINSLWMHNNRVVIWCCRVQQRAWAANIFESWICIIVENHWWWVNQIINRLQNVLMWDYLVDLSLFSSSPLFLYNKPTKNTPDLEITPVLALVASPCLRWYYLSCWGSTYQQRSKVQVNIN